MRWSYGVPAALGCGLVVILIWPVPNDDALERAGGAFSRAVAAPTEQTAEDLHHEAECTQLLNLAPGLDKSAVINVLQRCQVSSVQPLIRHRRITQDADEIPAMAGARRILAGNNYQHSVDIEFVQSVVTRSLLSHSLEPEFGDYFAVGASAEQAMMGLEKIMRAYPDVAAFEDVPTDEARYVLFEDRAEPEVDVLFNYDLWFAVWDAELIEAPPSAGRDLGPSGWYFVFHFDQGRLLSVAAELPAYYVEWP